MSGPNLVETKQSVAGFIGISTQTRGGREIDWIRKALSSRKSMLSRFARKLKRHAVGILNYFDFPIYTAKVEGINNRIKVIKRKAYGYRDMNYFMLKIYNIHTTRYSLLR